ncbi:MAG: hypothetical protein J0I79_16395 [Mesorhizobium sp.]|uniref:hypothetical protein n=1 Tax=Mesorhizobium sp. TaxID=1871066 RepID=UPI001AC385C9|nr:hypothetical protein [Mesorhizobium sp.]MBN9219526.1 hypothetical protein [Mesorhizobium sp.]
MQPAKKMPTHDILVATPLTEKEKEQGVKPFWTKIGAAWSLPDGSGYSLVLQALPLDGRMVMKVPTAKEDDRPDPRDDPRYGQSDYQTRSNGR